MALAAKAMRLLLIEDQAPVADVMRDALSEDGHEVVIAPSGQEGLRELTRNYPDAVFLDVVLPDMDGVSVLREIRALDRQVPVIVITGFASIDQIEELERLGVSAVIPKPDALRSLAEVLLLVPERPRGPSAPGTNE